MQRGVERSSALTHSDGKSPARAKFAHSTYAQSAIPHEISRLRLNAMRVLQIATSYPLNEADATAPFIRSIARALAEDGHELQIIVPSRDGAPAETRESGILVHWTRYAPFSALNVIGHARSLKNDMRLRASAFAALPFFLAAAYRKASEIARAWKPEVAHSHWVLPSGLIGGAIARRYGIPHVISLHGSDVFVANSSRIFGAIAGRTLRGARAVTACSPYLAKEAARHGSDARRVRFLPYGVDTMRFATNAENVPGNPAPIVLAIGRLVEKKGFRLLIEQAPLFLAPDGRAELWIAGEGDDRPALEAARDGLGPSIGQRVKLLGPIDWIRIPGLLCQAAVVVVPSIRDKSGNEDGLPNVVLEAMSAGRAIVASDVGALSLVITDGETGRIVPAGNGAALGRAIHDLLRDPAEAARLGKSAARAARANYSWSAYARELEALYVS